MSEIEELKPPHTIFEATRAMELVRIWIVDGKQQVSISGNLWDDPAAWGLMLVDLAKHIANAYRKTDGIKKMCLIVFSRDFKLSINRQRTNPLR